MISACPYLSALPSLDAVDGEDARQVDRLLLPRRSGSGGGVPVPATAAAARARVRSRGGRVWEGEEEREQRQRLPRGRHRGRDRQRGEGGSRRSRSPRVTCKIKIKRMLFGRRPKTLLFLLHIQYCYTSMRMKRGTQSVHSKIQSGTRQVGGGSLFAVHIGKYCNLTSIYI